MKTPRVSLATMSVVVALFALDFALIRWPFEGAPSFAKTFAIGSLPMANALILGLYRILRFRERRLPFTLGFEVAGWLATLAFAAALAIAPDAVMGWLFAFAVKAVTASHLAFGGDAPGLSDNSASGVAFQIGIVMAFFTPPTLLAALAGGVVGRLRAHGEIASGSRVVVARPGFPGG